MSSAAEGRTLKRHVRRDCDRCAMAPFHPAVRDWFTCVFRDADARAGAGLAGDRPRRLDADLRADRQRQDAGGVSLGARPADVRAARRDEGRARCRVRLHLAAQGAGRRRRAQPARAARGHRATSPPSAAMTFVMPRDRHPHRRHAAARARALPARARRHPHHHAGVALSAADVERARGAARRRDGHHRRDPRARADQARRAPGALAGAARARSATQPPQRIGLSATQRPLEEVARFLGGCRGCAGREARAPRTAQTPTPAIHDEFERHASRASGPSPSSTPARRSSSRCTSKCRSRTWRSSASSSDMPSGPAAQGPVRASIWPAIHPRLLELIRAHRSTLIFVNSRRLAERLAAR